MNEEQSEEPNSRWRRLRILFALLICPLLLRLPLVSNLIKDVGLAAINDVSKYHIAIDNLSIRPWLLAVKVDGVVIADDTQVLATIPSGYVGFQPPIDGQLVRTVILDSPNVTLNLDLLQNTEDPNTEAFTIPDLPKIQVRSASINITSSDLDVSVPDINFTSAGGDSHLWADEPIILNTATHGLHVSPFQWNDVSIVNDHLEINDINLETSLGNVYGALGIHDDEIVGKLETIVDLGPLIQHPKWSGVGEFRIGIETAGPLHSPKVVIQTSSDPFSLTRQATTREFTYLMDRMDGEIVFTDGEWVLNDVEVGWADGVSIINGTVQPSENLLNVTIAGHQQNLWGLGQDLDLSLGPWVEMQVDSTTQLSGGFSPLHLTGTIEISGQEFASGSGNVRVKAPVLKIPKVNLAGTVQVTKTDLNYQLTTVELGSQFNTTSVGTINGSFSFPPPNLSTVEFQFDTLDLRLLRPLGGSEFIGFGQGSGVLKGPMKKLQLESAYTITDFSMLGFEYADELTIQINGQNLKELHVVVDDAKKGTSTLSGEMDVHFRKELWFDGQFVSDSARANNLMSIFFEPLDVDAVASGNVSVVGYASDLHIDATMSLTDATLWGEHFDTGRFRLVQDKRHLTIEEFIVERNDGLGSVMMRGTRTGGNNNFEVLIGGLPIEYLSWIIDGKVPVRGKLDFLGTIQGESFLPNGSLQIRDFWHGTHKLGKSKLLIHNQPEGLVIQGQLADGVLVKGIAGYGLDEDFAFDVEATNFPVEALYTLSLSEQNVTGRVSVDGLFWQRQGEMGGDFTVENAKLTWSDRWLELKDSTDVLWDGVSLNIDPFSLTGSGQTNLSIDGWKKGHKHAVQFDGTLDMAVTEMILVGTDSAAGTGYLTGQWTESGLSATIDIQNGFIQGTWFPHPIESIRSQLHITEQEVIFKKWDSIVGGGTVGMTGSMLLEDFYPKSYDLQLGMQNSRIQLLDWLPPVVGSGDFKISGDAELPMIRGAVEASEMTFVDRIGWEGALITFAPEAIAGSAAEDAEPYFEYDIDFTANNTIRIRNNLADMTASADLKFVGDMASPGMIGRIDLTEGGRALFKERDFDVLRGSMRYEDPLSFDPILDIALETSVITPENEVSIKYFITGLYSDWQTHTTSTPSLPQADINALLLFGMTRRELETEGGLGAALAIEGSDLVVSKFGSSQRFVEVGSGIFQSELLRLDRVDIISGPTDRNSAYVSSALRLLAEKDIGDGTIRLEQNVTDTTDVFVSWEQKLTQRLYTRLYWASQQQGRSINGRGAVGAEFEIQWELD